jgi:hypothetical protein
VGNRQNKPAGQRDPCGPVLFKSGGRPVDAPFAIGPFSHAIVGLPPYFTGRRKKDKSLYKIVVIARKLT